VTMLRRAAYDDDENEGRLFLSKNLLLMDEIDLFWLAASTHEEAIDVPTGTTNALT